MSVTQMPDNTRSQWWAEILSQTHASKNFTITRFLFALLLLLKSHVQLIWWPIKISCVHFIRQVLVSNAEYFLEKSKKRKIGPKLCNQKWNRITYTKYQKRNLNSKLLSSKFDALAYKMKWNSLRNSNMEC